jgi:hypothetical protein
MLLLLGAARVVVECAEIDLHHLSIKTLHEHPNAICVAKEARIPTSKPAGPE